MLDTQLRACYRTGVYCSEPYRRAVELQRLVLEKARQDETKGAVLSGLARAYCELEETKRKLRMKPLPKAIDVDSQGKPNGKRSRPRSATEPTEA